MEEPEFKFTLRTEGPMYQNPMPTEKLQAEIEELGRQLDEARAELARTQAQLRVAQTHICPDPNCRNCGRWRSWYSDWGRDWYRCPECGAGPGKPCWDRRAAQGQLVRGRPHKRRKEVQDPLVGAPGGP